MVAIMTSFTEATPYQGQLLATTLYQENKLLAGTLYQGKVC
jgi:hypothetical protein